MVTAIWMFIVVQVFTLTCTGVYINALLLRDRRQRQASEF